MDVHITQTETCECGRAIIGITGRCAICIRQAAIAFWAKTGHPEVIR